MQIIQPIDKNIWWDIAQQCEYATFFHTPLWHELATTTFPQYKDVTLWVEFDNGTQAILPLLQSKRLKGLSRYALSSFGGCYGDIIAMQSISDTDRLSLFNHITSSNYMSIQIVENPIHSFPPPGEQFKKKEDFTTILPLDSSFDTLFSNFSKHHKRCFNKGLRMNVSVRQSQSLTDYYDYYKAYEDTLNRWGEKATSQYPWTLFENLFYLSQQYPDNIKLWLAIVDEKIVSGAIIFYWNQHVDYWHGAAYKDYFDHHPNNVLHTQIIKDALEKGYKYYDFNPSGGHEGVIQFKSRFGTQNWPIIRWKYESRGFHLSRKMKGTLFHGK